MSEHHEHHEQHEHHDEQQQHEQHEHQQHGEHGEGRRPRRLGRGLNALLGGGGDDDHGERNEAPAEAPAGDLRKIDIHAIERNPFQPRQEFDEDGLKELTESILQHGLLQPLLVRPNGESFQLIAGERRLIAAKRAGLETVPCQVREFDDQTVSEVAIEENLKRKDLNVLEKAQAFREYIQRFNSSIEELAGRLSMDRSTVSNILRLLDLPEPVKNSLAAGKISAGHARALLPLPESDQTAMCGLIESEQLSVRKTEQEVRAVLKGEGTVPFRQPKEKPAPPELSNHLQSLQDQLRDHLGAQVEIKLKGKDAGRIIIEFSSNDDFERIVRNLRRAA